MVNVSSSRDIEADGNEIHFLNIEECGLRNPSKPYDDDLNATNEYWRQDFLLYKASKAKTLIFDLTMAIL